MAWRPGGWRPSGGLEAEETAERWCREQGWKTLARNFRVAQGELDLVCDDGDSLVFIEVRQRRNNRYGGAAASVTAAKQRKLVAAAQRYLQEYPRQARRPSRFDVITLDADGTLDWIKGAFTA